MAFVLRLIVSIFSMAKFDVNLSPMDEARKLSCAIVPLDIIVKFKTSDPKTSINIWMLATTYSTTSEIAPVVT